MRWILTRRQCRADGIFSDLHDGSSKLLAQTLEHAYDGLPTLEGEAGYRARIPNGLYTCERGRHLLHGMTEPFETFEIKGVPDCVGILIHWGNFNKDSEGCILVGAHVERAEDQTQMITDSKATFKRLMEVLQGVDTFELIVA